MILNISYRRRESSRHLGWSLGPRNFEEELQAAVLARWEARQREVAGNGHEHANDQPAVQYNGLWIAARIYVLPRLHECEPKTVLQPILLLHALRHLGLMFLAPGAHYAGLAPEFAYPAALGDVLAALLALIAIPAVATGASVAKLLVWLFNVWGTLDLLAAIALATVYDASLHMGPAYWIPAFWVPALLVTHYITFILLLRHWTGATGKP